MDSDTSHDEQMREQARTTNSDTDRWKEDCRQAHELYDLVNYSHLKEGACWI